MEPKVWIDGIIGHVRTVADLDFQKRVWTGREPAKTKDGHDLYSCYVEEMCGLFDDFCFDDLLRQNFINAAKAYWS